MIDITNKSIDELNDLVIKYNQILSPYIKRHDIHYITYIVDIAVNYIVSKYDNIDSDVKTWCILIIFKIYDILRERKLNTFNNVEDIYKLIDSIIDYTNNEHPNYIKNLDLISVTSTYHRDLNFYNNFVELYLSKTN